MDMVLALDKLGVPTEDRGPSAQSDAAYSAMVAAWKGPPPVPTLEQIATAWNAVLTERSWLSSGQHAIRPLLDIVTDLNALTGAQKNAVWTDLTSGTPPKWALSEGPNSGAKTGTSFA